MINCKKGMLAIMSESEKFIKEINGEITKAKLLKSTTEVYEENKYIFSL